MNTAGTSCSTTLPSATTTLYSYDGEGHRTASSNNGVTNAFIWDTGASQLLADSTHDYVYLQGSVSPDLQINLTTGTVDLLIQDQNANTRGVVQVVGTNSTFDGTIVNYTDYDAYGNAITQSGGSVNPGGMSNGGVTTDISTAFAFGAGYWDSSNLTYLVHRYLDNESGQFISVDPLVDQTREAYVYAGDEPVGHVDALGLFPSLSKVLRSVTSGISLPISLVGSLWQTAGWVKGNRVKLYEIYSGSIHFAARYFGISARLLATVVQLEGGGFETLTRAWGSIGRTIQQLVDLSGVVDHPGIASTGIQEVSQSLQRQTGTAMSGFAIRSGLALSNDFGIYSAAAYLRYIRDEFAKRGFGSMSDRQVAIAYNIGGTSLFQTLVSTNWSGSLATSRGEAYDKQRKIVSLSARYARDI